MVGLTPKILNCKILKKTERQIMVRCRKDHVLSPYGRAPGPRVPPTPPPYLLLLGEIVRKTVKPAFWAPAGAFYLHGARDFQTFECTSQMIQFGE